MQNTWHFSEWSSDQAIMYGLHRNYCKIEDALVQRRPEQSKCRFLREGWMPASLASIYLALVSSEGKTLLSHPRKFMAEFFYSFAALLPSAWSSSYHVPSLTHILCSLLAQAVQCISAHSAHMWAGCISMPMQWVWIWLTNQMFSL